MAEVSDLNVTDASNTARFPENQAASTVNDGARALEGMLARHFKDSTDGFITTGGTSTVYTAASNKTLSAYHDGLTLTLELHTATGATPTLNVDSVGAQSLVWPDGTAVAANDIGASIIVVKYDVTNTNWVVMSVPGGPSTFANVVDDTTPQLGGQLDVNGNAIGDGTNELLTFTEDASAVNHVNIENEATGSGPIISAAGDDTNVDLLLAGKGTGVPKIGSNAILDAGDLANASTINTGTSTTETPSVDGLAGSVFGTKEVQILVFDASVSVSTGDGAGNAFMRVPSTLNGMDLVGVAATVDTAGVTGTTDIQIHNVTQAADMLSTKITIDTGETDSSTAATPPVIDTANDDVATGDKIRIDVDAVSSGTAPTGLLVEMQFRLP